MTVNHGIVELLAALHKIFVPLLHITIRDGFYTKNRKQKTGNNKFYTYTV